ncbi:LuxR C-terminal-related transcriptional regulator [Aquimarina sp. 2201CG1-2-11]|uniref:LuxR C-terminal-related transcriptional regulator n=1 Tax=Aquimarina discodermiae TaxID=3231043 RepID=UPI003461B4AB
MELEYTEVSAKILDFVPNASQAQELFGRRIGYSDPKYPGFYHIHSIKDYSVIYFDEEICKEFDASLEDIRAIGAKFQESVTHPDDVKRVRKLLFDFAEKQNETEILTYFHRLKFRKEGEEGYILVITSVKLDLAQQAFISMSNTTDQLPVFTKKICNALNTKYETKKYINSYITLTKREKEVFTFLIRGFSVKEVASSLIRSTRTIEQHKKNIYKKMEVNTLAQIVRIGYFLNLV